MLNMENLRAKIRTNQDSRGGTGGGSYNRETYPFYKIPYGAKAVIRFLPDGNPANTATFWQETKHYRLKFPGVVGEEPKDTFVNVPFAGAYADPDPAYKCPIKRQVSLWFGEANGDKASPEWKLAVSYMPQERRHYNVLVRDNPLEETDLPASPVRRVSFGFQLNKKVDAGLMNTAIKDVPCDYQAGRDFEIHRNRNQGGFPDYSDSTFSFAASALTAEEIAAVEEHGLPDLSAQVMAKPGKAELEVIGALFQASLAGDYYDPAQFADYYRPFGLAWGDKAAGPKTDAPGLVEPAKPAPKKKAPAKPKIEPAPSAAEQVMARKADGEAPVTGSAAEILTRLQKKKADAAATDAAA